jgi:hypothetical protein
MFPLVPYIISENLYKKSLDAARMSITMTTTQCMYISYVHDSALLWGLFDALTTSHNELSVCARAFTKVDVNAIRNVIGI